MRPWYASEPSQLDGARVATVSDPVAVSRAWGLFVLLDAPERRRRDPPAAPEWVRDVRTLAGALLGRRTDQSTRPALNQAVLDWSRSDPAGLLAAARRIALKEAIPDDEQAQRLYRLIDARCQPGLASASPRARWNSF